MYHMGGTLQAWKETTIEYGWDAAPVKRHSICPQHNTESLLLYDLLTIYLKKYNEKMFDNYLIV